MPEGRTTSPIGEYMASTTYRIRYKDGRTQEVEADKAAPAGDFIYFDKGGNIVFARRVGLGRKLR